VEILPKKRQTRSPRVPFSELYIHGKVESWHVIMVAHDHTIEVPRERAQYEEKKPDGTLVYTRKTVSDDLTLEMDLVLRNPIRGFNRLQFHITEWDEEKHGGIAGELKYDKELGMRGGVHMSGSFPRDLYALLLSGTGVAMAIETKRGFYRRVAWVKSVAFSDIEHPQWIDEESGLI